MDASAGPALFRLVRFWSRRWAQTGQETSARQARVHDIAVLDAVDAAARLAPGVTVTEVAHQLGIDRSGASRFIAAAVAHGHLQRRTSHTDARRALLVITPAGAALLRDSHAFQERVFAELTSTWSPTDARRFGGYLRRLADELPTASDPDHT
ncbi:MAG: MarR family winged helix-turn-helix transcriptional regulator [Phycicoccus sp.]